MTFKEYIPPSPTLDLALERNPLAEVRWWRFLLGDAYANPFHDLLYAFSRSVTPVEAANIPGRPPLRTVEFQREMISVRLPEGVQKTYPYTALAYLKLDHTDQVQASTLSNQYAYFTMLEYATLEGKERICLRMSGVQTVALCDFLLANGVRFKEYRLGMRSFRQRTNFTYSEIQVLKRKHGIEW